MAVQYDRIDYDFADNVATIRMNDPATLNALSLSMVEELLDALERAAGEARAVVLAGAGKSFSSGANLADGSIETLTPDRDVGAALATHYNPLLMRMRDLSVPVVTAVKGAAAGVAFALALTGDIIVAGRNAYFLQAFARIGLVPDGGSAYLLARTIGRVRAMELMLLAEKYPAEQAFRDGMVTRLAEDDAVDATAHEIAAKLAAGPTASYALIKRSAWAALESNFEDQLARERDYQRTAGRTSDFIEGVTAFLEKRKADFKGE